MQKTKKLLAAVAIAGIAAAGGSAFTNSNTIQQGAGITVGYGSQTVSGVTATSVVYNLNSTKDQVTGVTIVLDGDTTGLDVQTAFNSDDTATCSGAGAFDAVEDETTYTCAMPLATTALQSFHLFATDDI